MNSIIIRLKTYIAKTGIKGILSIPAFFIFIWIGIDAYRKEGSFYLVFFFAGIAAAALLKNLLLRYSNRFLKGIRIFMFLALIAGFAAEIPIVKKTAGSYESLFVSLIIITAGFILSSVFIIFSEPDQ